MSLMFAHCLSLATVRPITTRNNHSLYYSASFIVGLLLAYFNYGDVIGPKAAEFGEITQNNGHWRSTIFVPMLSPYATSYA